MCEYTCFDLSPARASIEGTRACKKFKMALAKDRARKLNWARQLIYENMVRLTSLKQPISTPISLPSTLC